MLGAQILWGRNSVVSDLHNSLMLKDNITK